MSTATKDFPIVSDVASIQRAYEQMRAEGTSHNLAEMFALQQPPQADDDTTFLASQRPREQFAGTPHLGDFYAREAKARGDNISGAVYQNGLARYPGDPDAWVHDRGEIRKKCEQRGIGCEGAVNVKARNDVAPKESVDVAPDLVVAKAKEEIRANPGLKMSADLLEKSKNKIKPHWSKK